jgi:sulfur carrier protein
VELIINSDKVQVPETVTTVSDLLAHFKLDQKVVIVELNTTILEKSNHGETKLANGDKIEIVHFVGGG